MKPLLWHVYMSLPMDVCLTSIVMMLTNFSPCPSLYPFSLSVSLSFLRLYLSLFFSVSLFSIPALYLFLSVSLSLPLLFFLFNSFLFSLCFLFYLSGSLFLFLLYSTFRFCALLSSFFWKNTRYKLTNILYMLQY